MRVLIVDDHEDNLYYLRTLLSAHGYEVESAHDGAEALASARDLPPDVVISDLLMPVMDGYTLLRQWKADDRLKAIPFIVYTATYTDPDDERLAKNLGADAFILKPTEPETFLERLREVRAADEAMIAPAPDSLNDERVFLREYNEALVRKLEAKTLQLEETNRSLQKDLKERLEIESALRESEIRFRQLAENIDDVFWLSSPEKDRYYYISPAYETVFGQSREALYDSAESGLAGVHPEDRARVKAGMLQQRTGHYEDVYRIIRGDGFIRWIRARSYPVRDENGKVYRIAGVSRDITEKHRLEEEVRQAQKMEAVGRLAGGIAHDFNNMLSVILSYASLIVDELPESGGGRMRADVEEVRLAGERAAELTKQLLAFSRRQVLQPKTLDLSQSLIGMQPMLKRLLREDIELVLLVSPQPCKIHADPSQVEQVIMNLVVNARDAMPRGGKLSIETSIVEQQVEGLAAGSGPYVMFTVTDTGMGMDALTKERVFEPFFTTKEKGKGTGLGLATVFGIVQQSNGHVSVDSEVGRGTTFKVYLPRTGRAQDDVPASAPASTTALRRGTETILLVEDDDQVRVMTRTVLRRHGYNVLDAQNGGEAYLTSEKFKSKIDLLVTDVVMPRMSGRELADRLVSMRPEMRVLYVSGYTEDTIVHHGVLDERVHLLQKPITPHSLLSKVREVLDI